MSRVRTIGLPASTIRALFAMMSECGSFRRSRRLPRTRSPAVPPASSMLARALPARCYDECVFGPVQPRKYRRMHVRDPRPPRRDCTRVGVPSDIADPANAGRGPRAGRGSLNNHAVGAKPSRSRASPPIVSASRIAVAPSPASRGTSCFARCGDGVAHGVHPICRPVATNGRTRRSRERVTLVGRDVGRSSRGCVASYPPARGAATEDARRAGPPEQVARSTRSGEVLSA